MIEITEIIKTIRDMQREITTLEMLRTSQEIIEANKGLAAEVERLRTENENAAVNVKNLKFKLRTHGLLEEEET
jgi:hypothetical protein